MTCGSYKKIYQTECFTLITFLALYIAQAVPAGFLSTSLQVLMRENHYSLAAIGMLQLIKLPWIFKFLWAPEVDKRCSSLKDYKRCIIGWECVYALLLIGISVLDIKEHLYLIIGAVILALIASGTQDIATDALAAITFRKKDKSMVNSMQSMGNFGGTLVGSGLLLITLHHYGWTVVMTILAIFVLLAMLPLFKNRHIQVEESAEKKRVSLKDIPLFFSRPGIFSHVLTLILYYAPIITILSMLRPYLVDLGLNIKEIGFLSGIIGTGTAFITSLGAGLFIRKKGMGVVQVTTTIMILITAIYFLGFHISGMSRVQIVIGIILLWAAYACASVFIYTRSMSIVRSGREGTDFTIQIVITHLSSMTVAVLSGWLADRLGYSYLFAMAASLATINLLRSIIIRNKIIQQDNL